MSEFGPSLDGHYPGSYGTDSCLPCLCVTLIDDRGLHSHAALNAAADSDEANEANHVHSTRDDISSEIASESIRVYLTRCEVYGGSTFNIQVAPSDAPSLISAGICQ